MLDAWQVVYSFQILHDRGHPQLSSCFEQLPPESSCSSEALASQKSSVVRNAVAKRATCLRPIPFRPAHACNISLQTKHVTRIIQLNVKVPQVQCM